MVSVAEGAYREWLVSKQLPEAHVKAHVFALEFFSQRGGIDRDSMRQAIADEQQAGAQVTRLKNLQAAAQLLLQYQDEHPPGPPPSAPLLDLELAEPVPLTLAEPEASPPVTPPEEPPPAFPRGTVEEPKVEADDVARASEADEPEFPLCQCVGKPKIALMIQYAAIIGPVYAVLYIGLKFKFGFDFANMVECALLALGCVLAAIFIRVECETCSTTLDIDDLKKRYPKELNKERLKLLGLGAVCLALALFFKGGWDEKRDAEREAEEWAEQFEEDMGEFEYDEYDEYDEDE